MNAIMGFRLFTLPFLRTYLIPTINSEAEYLFKKFGWPNTMESNENPLWPSFLNMMNELSYSFYQTGESWFRVLVPRQERSVANQIVMITGSSSELGRQLALRMARRGARIVLWDVEQGDQDVTEEFVINNVNGARINGYIVDFHDADSTRNAAEAVKTDVGSVDLIIHAYESRIQDHKLGELNKQDLERDFNENVLSLFNVVNSSLPQMKSTGKGQIVSVAGLAGHLGLPRLSSYCASKYAVVGFLDSLRAELKSDGLNDILITELSPYHCLPFADSKRDGENVESCSDLMADEATKRILRNESKIMIPAIWAILLMSLKFLMPVESLFSLSRAVKDGESILKSLARDGRKKLDNLAQAIETKPQSESTSSSKPTTEISKPQEEPQTEPPLPATSDTTSPSGTPVTNPGQEE